jgi:hypothetical protein
MPSIKKAEYENLKAAAKHYHEMARQSDQRYYEIVSLKGEIRLLQSKLKHAEQLRDQASSNHVAQLGLYEISLRHEKIYLEQVQKSLRDQQWETERWKRYYEAAIKTFKIQEYVEMPGCFNPMESIEYIAKQQEQHEKDEIPNRQGC